MISLLQFPATSMPTPQRVFSQFKKIVLDFLWNGKTSKIAYNMLIQELGVSGLRVPDLETRVQVIHLNWVKHMWCHQDSLLASVLKNSLSYSNTRQLLLCKTNFANRINSQYRMLYGILNTWHSLHRFNPSTEQLVQQESLWFNDNITIDKVPICWRSWLNAGIVNINDILHSECPRFLSHEEISTKYNITVPFLKILQIRSCLPFAWRLLLQSPANQDTCSKPFIQTTDDSLLDILKATSRSLYSTLVLRKRQPVAAQRKWDAQFPVPPDLPSEIYWESNNKASFKSVRETKIQAFQFRLLHKILPCNKYLKDIRVKSSDSCSFCDLQDTLVHFFSDLFMGSTLLEGFM